MSSKLIRLQRCTPQQSLRSCVVPLRGCFSSYIKDQRSQRSWRLCKTTNMSPKDITSVIDLRKGSQCSGTINIQILTDLRLTPATQAMRLRESNQNLEITRLRVATLCGQRSQRHQISQHAEWDLNKIEKKLLTGPSQGERARISGSEYICLKSQIKGQRNGQLGSLAPPAKSRPNWLSYLVGYIYQGIQDAGPSLEQVPQVPGNRDILSSYVMAPHEIFRNF